MCIMSTTVSCVNERCPEPDVKIDDDSGRCVCRGCRVVFHVCPHCRADESCIVEDRGTGERVCESCAAVLGERSVREEYDATRHHAPEMGPRDGPQVNETKRQIDALVADQTIPQAVGEAAKSTAASYGDANLKRVHRTGRVATLWACIALGYEQVGIKMEMQEIAASAGSSVSVVCIRRDAVKAATGVQAMSQGLVGILLQPLNRTVLALFRTTSSTEAKAMKHAVLRMAKALDSHDMSSVTNLRPATQVCALLLFQYMALGRTPTREEKAALASGKGSVAKVARALSAINFV
jgi:hypothetical protein